MDGVTGDLFGPARRFAGLPEEAFRAFGIPDHERRRRALVEGFHPALRVLGEDLVEALGLDLHLHLPRLDWPPGYRPFCTWLALSPERHGYQGQAQLNIGVHADHVGLRLGWDTAADRFGRFVFLARFGGVGEGLAAVAAGHGLAFRVYASAPWPEGSRLVFASDRDWTGSLEVARCRGVWWEVGVRLDLPSCASRVLGPGLGLEAERIFRPLLPVLERLTGAP